MPPPASNRLWWWEHRWLPAEDLLPTPLPARWLLWTTLLAAVASAALAMVPFGPWWLLFPLLGRLCALDIHYRVLPDVYTVPLAVIGLGMALWHGHLGASALTLAVAISLLLVALGSQRLLTGHWPNLGGGDVKFMLAAACWLPYTHFPWFLLLACVVMLPVALLSGRKHLPFGPALIASFVFVLFHQNFTESLILRAFFLMSN